MSLKSIVNKARESRGFTIVELLIVIVVIGILATITIVAYNNVTDRARTSSAQAAAKTVINKAAVYQAEEGSYPVSLDTLTSSSDSGEAWYIPDGSITASTGELAAGPSDPQTITFYRCDDTDGSTGGTGVAVGYWDYSAGALVDEGTTAYTVGDVTNCAVFPASE